VAIEKLTENVEIIQTLDDYPNTTGGLTARELKQKFDEGNRVIKEYLNTQVVPAINQNSDQLQEPRHLVVAVNPETNYANYSSYEILALWEAGWNVVLSTDLGFALLSGTDFENVYFELWLSDGLRRLYCVQSDNRIDEVVTQIATVEDLEGKITSLNQTWESAHSGLSTHVENLEENIGRITPLVVTYDPEAFTASHTAKEIYEQSASRSVLLYWSNAYWSPLRIDINEAVFLVRVSGDVMYYYTIDSTGGCRPEIVPYVTTEDLQSAIGDISTALDGIIDDSEIGSNAWSSKHTVDKLCPAFSESGSVVQCEPVEGYPLKVMTQLPEGTEAVTLTHCGKNLFDCNSHTFSEGYVSQGSGVFHSSGNYCLTKYVPIAHLQGQTITLNKVPGGSNPGMAFYDADKVYISGGDGTAMTVPDNAAYMCFSVPIAYIDGDEIQIEIGKTATEFEPYRGQTYTATPSAESQDWGGIPALPGINTLYCDSGVTTVEGKSDPVAIIEKLTNAIISLGGNV